MRSLQRLRYVQAPPDQELRRIHNAERRSVRRRERRLWGRRMRLVSRMALVAAFLVLATWAVWGGRVLIEGLVTADVVIARAPARVLVVDVLCTPGQRCEPGTPLLRLASTAPKEERRVLELALDRQRLRLALSEAGGELGETDLARRGDRFVEAEREATLAEADRRVAQAAVASLTRQRSSRALELRQALAERRGDVAALDQRVAEAHALVERARTQTDFAEWDAASRTELGASGVLPERERVSALATQSSSQREVEALEAALRAREEEREAARLVAEISAEQLEASLAEIDARLEEARAKEDAAAKRRDLWGEFSVRQRELGANARADEARTLRELELLLLRAEVAEAEARLSEFDRLHGETIVRAETAGVIERVFVRPGTPVEADEPLVRYFDPTSLRVVAYLSAEDGDPPYPGQACRVLPTSRGDSYAGGVTRVDSVWAPLPGLLNPEGSETVALRLAVHVEVPALDERQSLAPNQRVRVLMLERPRDEPVEEAQAAARP